MNDLEALMDSSRSSVRNLAQIIDEVSPGYFTGDERPQLYTGFPKLDECLVV